ncbi:hypothetical protein K5V21_05850 [Clostridium sardiniense]|uniref:Metalloenzyme domain-containing protein n=1 Tax=Clostridium sardiniense TaxID=29369 RepID=A0ABS7KW01_CLOSR|nr:hypothetical protein [Clostridium sardiniense]MBY0754976.1 hypothetical protein [Clostridium sardiniense]MDQ0459170.1 2,3-bisphosphoglycerate-independent phosphoglycerate mutase [Clostridium sardiniense]
MMRDKKILVILDGYFENTKKIKEVIDSKFKSLESITKFSYRGMMDSSIKGYDVDSLNCIFNILGYSPKENKIYERAYFEALSKGYKLKMDESVLRCNLVKIEDDRLKDFTSGLSKEESRAITHKFIENLEKNKSLSKDFKMIHCDAYRNLLFINKNYYSLKDIIFSKPHDNTGKMIGEIMPKSNIKEDNDGLLSILEFMRYSYSYFKNIGYEGIMLYPWGLSKKTSLTSMKEKFELDGAVIAGIDLLKGMGLSIGLKKINLSNATGDYDTLLIEKRNKGKEAIDKFDFLLIHINGCDELSHRKDTEGKAIFIEKIFTEMINPLLKHIEDNYSKYSMLITGDHITNSMNGMHERGEGEYLLLSSDYRNIKLKETMQLIELLLL